MNMQDYDWIPRGDYNQIIHHKSYNTEHGFSIKICKAVSWLTDAHSLVMFVVFKFMHHTYIICAHYRLQVYVHYAKRQKLGNFCDHERNKIECPSHEEQEPKKNIFYKRESFWHVQNITEVPYKRYINCQTCQMKNIHKIVLKIKRG
jgi:hypothetical protein